MATEQNNTSVIAKLMGFDVAPCQQQQKPDYTLQRVVFENYLEKLASIGSHGKKSSKIRQKLEVKKVSTDDDSFNGLQGLKSPILGSKTSNLALGSNGKRESKPLFLLDSRTISGWGFKKQLLERSKRTKVSQEIWSRKRVCNRGELPSMPDLESNKRSELGTRVSISNCDVQKDNSVTELPVFERFNQSSSYKTKIKNISNGDLNLSSVKPNENVSANSQDAEFSFTSVSCIDVTEELASSMGEANQPSPNSVLEPDNSSSSEYGESVCTDLHGLWMKLQILKSESEETPSNESESASSQSVPTGQNTKPIRCFGPKESQQFSYMVNVLNELGFHGDNMELSFENCTTNQLNPTMFKALEKNYENQKSWDRADRLLLFDFVNSGLTEIVGSKSLKRKVSNVLRRDVVEEELWSMLLSQQKEVNVDLSAKAVGNELWLELRDEVESIVVEIEGFLFDELAAELVAV